ncbi:gamma-glutamylcyclotransferase [Frigidibacter oleivorans]|uniref:gamma-glutamylcyclotransferase n=1 Tax=Frigidibacter oleivorans TaxID=2487129 RepID=UPI00197A87BC|nr:gamma-glutamylcyclotransferase [Frigidibacter oleivorans]
MPFDPAPAASARRMTLTPELVARAFREVEDPGLPPEWTALTDEDFARLADDWLERSGGGPVRVFAYGSLIWNPGFPVGRITRGVAHGWHRSFCLHLTSWRGSPEYPGLMLALEAGGSAAGLLMEVAPGEERAGIEALLRREIAAREHTHMVRVVSVRSEGEAVPALTFWAGPKGEGVVSLPVEEQARRLATACGHRGSGAEYLYNTVAKLEEHGIHDRNLWQLQHLTAEELVRRHASPAA